MKYVLHALVLALLAGTSGVVQAIESNANSGPQAPQSGVTGMSSKIDTNVAILQLQITGMTQCNNLRKFYAPSDPKKDADGCVGIDDYSVAMKSGNGLGTAGGQVNATSAAAGTFTAAFGNTVYGGLLGDGPSIGVYGHSANGQAVIGSSDTNWSGYFNGGTNGYGAYGVSTAHEGVYGNSTSLYGVRGASSSSYGGYFTGTTYGVYANGTTTAAQFDGNMRLSAGSTLCIGTSCTNSLAPTAGGGTQYGGSYELRAGSICFLGNPYTGTCSCPSGFGNYTTHNTNDNTGTWYTQQTCMKGTPS